MMEFELTEEQRMIRDLVRDFAHQEIAPRVEEDDRRGRLPMELVWKLGELGILGMVLPEEWGGGGSDYVSYVVAIEELARVSPALAVTLSVSCSVGALPIARAGTEAQKEKFLRPLAEGRMLGAFALTEPGAGSDVRAISTTARQEAGHYILDGTKIWVTNGTECGVMITMAVTGRQNGRKEISAFLVEPDSPGVNVRLMEGKLGLHSSSTAEVVFEEARIPRENLLGAEGKGLRVALGALEGGRVGIAAHAVGIAQACLDRAVDYARERHAFGRAIGQFEAIQTKLGEMAARVSASRLLTRRAAWMMDRGLGCPKEASMAKLYATETANFVAAEAIQIHGGYGFMEEFGLARFYRDVRVATIFEGTNEIQRMLIARSVLSSAARSPTCSRGS